MHRCLFCYKPLTEREEHFHASCAKRFFGTSKVPSLDFTREEMDGLAAQVIEEQTSLTGVQPKLSLHLTEHADGRKLTIVGLWGGFICKPQSVLYPMLPEIEDLTMHLAEQARIAVVPHTLMPMADGTLCYLTKRIDRLDDGGKLAMEDMCQLSERLTEHKYRSSYERIAKVIRQYSAMPKMDVTDFFEVVLFSWITGNNDMHLKNFSLIECQGQWRLSPAYDLLNATIANPADDEELALTLNGRKRHVNREDFLLAGVNMGIERNVVEHLMRKYVQKWPDFASLIERSFLDDDLKQSYLQVVENRLSRLAEM